MTPIGYPQQQFISPNHPALAPPENEMCAIGQIPEDVLKHIFSFVPAHQGLGALEACKRFRKCGLESLDQKTSEEMLKKMQQPGEYEKTEAARTAFFETVLNTLSVFKKISFPIETAAFHGQLNIVKLLLERELEKLTNHVIYISLCSSVQRGHLEVVQEFLKHSKINQVVSDHPWALKVLIGYACIKGSTEIFKELFKFPLAISCDRYNENYDLAVRRGHREIFEIFWQDPRFKPLSGFSRD